MFTEVMEKVLALFAEGYAVYIGSYYGESLEESAEDIVDVFDDVEGDEWLYIQSVSVDDAAREVHVFIGNDE